MGRFLGGRNNNEGLGDAIKKRKSFFFQFLYVVKVVRTNFEIWVNFGGLNRMGIRMRGIRNINTYLKYSDSVAYETIV